LRSHGLAWLAPNFIDEAGFELTTTLALPQGGARTVRIVEAPPGSIDRRRGQRRHRTRGARHVRAR